MIKTNPLDALLGKAGLDSIEANFRCILVIAPPPAKASKSALSWIARRLPSEPSARLLACRGKLLSNLSRLPEARDCLLLSLREDPNQAAAHAWLAGVHALERHFPLAGQAASSAIALDPKCAWAYFYRALAGFAVGDADAAVADLRLLLSLPAPPRTPPAVAAHAFLGILESQRGRFPQAQESIREVIRARPKEGWPYALRAMVHRRRGDATACLRDLDRALRLHPAGWIHLERALLREEIGQAEPALGDLDSALALQGPSPALYRRRAVLAASLGRFERAVRDFNRVASSPGSDEEFRGLALVLALELEKGGRARRALSVLRKAVNRSPKDGELRLILSQLLERLKLPREASRQLKTAEGLLRDALRRPGAGPAPLVSLARALFGQARWPQARDAALEVLERYGGPEAAETILTESILKLGRFQEAETLLRKRLARRPASGAGAALARVLLLQGKFPEAESAVLEELKRRPDAETPMSILIQAVSAQGRNKESLELSRRALLAHPRSELLRNLRVRSLMDLGRLPEAETEVRDGLAANPRSEEMRQNLAAVLIRQGRAKELRAARLAPTPSQLREMREQGAYLMYHGRFKEAEKVLQSSLEFLKNDFDALFAWGKLKRFQLRPGEAADSYERACRLRPKNLRPYLYWAESLLLEGRVRRVFTVLERADRLCPRPPKSDLEGWLERYRLAACRLEFAEAARIGERVLDSTPAGGAIERLTWPVFVDDFEMFKRPPRYLKEAFSSLGRLIRREPRSPWGYYFRLYYTILSYDEAYGADRDREQLLSDSSKIESSPRGRYGWMRHELGRCRMNLRDFPGAVAAYRVAAASPLRPHWSTLCELAEAEMYAGDLDAALRAVDKGAALAPSPTDRDQCAGKKAKLLLWAGEYEGALAVLATIAGQGSAGPFYTWRGGALLKLGRVSEALATLDEGLAAHPTPEARIWRVEALYRAGRHAEAIREAQPLGKTNFMALAVAGLALGARGDLQESRRTIERIPEPVLRFVESRTGLAREKTENYPRRALESILDLSRGVRLTAYETALWLR